MSLWLPLDPRWALEVSRTNISQVSLGTVTVDMLLIRLVYVSLTDRIAVINLLHEARGLDTFPLTLQKFKSSGDDTSVAILKRNYEEEVHHVATGVKWFRYIYERDHNNNETSSKKESGCVQNFQEIVRKYHSGAIKGPFNTDARNRAGLTEEWYMPLTVV